MKKFLYQCIAVELSLSTLFGCESIDRREFEAPQLDVPSGWSQNIASNTHLEVEDKWWTLFNDEQLNNLIQQVLKTNSDLALATLTLKKARLEAGLSDNNQLPQISLSQNVSTQKNLDSGDTENEYSANLSLNYEVDLWGRLDAITDAAQWVAKASHQDRESTKQSLIVTAASLYWKLGYLNQKLTLTKSNIDGTEQIVELTKKKFQSGSVTKLDVLESTQFLFDQKASYSKLKQEVIETNNAMSLLVNRPLQDIGLHIETLPKGDLPNIAVGIPSDLLLRRPDISSSLYKLKSAFSNQESVDASYLPQFSLTGSLSTSSSNLLEILQNPIVALGSGLTLPFIEWNEMEFNKGIAELDYQMAVINYRNTLYDAFEEVDNLLNIKEYYKDQGEILNQQYINTQEIEVIYASKYKYGANDMIDWINAMESRRSMETSVIENRYNQFITQAKLYQSLGGSDTSQK